MSLWQRFFTGSREERLARDEENRGHLEEATALYVRASRPEEAARVLLLRAQSELEPRPRLRLLVQAASIAPKEHPLFREARVKRAKVLVAIAEGGGGGSAAASTMKQELIEAGEELLTLGEANDAVRVFRAAGYREGEQRALASAGDVDSLEALFASGAQAEKTERERSERHAAIGVAESTGERRLALALAEELRATLPSDAALRELVRSLTLRRATGKALRVRIDGSEKRIILGERVVLGRNAGDILVPSPAVSREHLAIYRENDAIVIADAGSRNGTRLRGLDIKGPLALSGELVLELGPGVYVTIAPSEQGAQLTVGRDVYFLPLSSKSEIAPSWTVQIGSDGWLELVTTECPIFQGNLQLSPSVTLLWGDAFTRARASSGPAIEILAP